MSHPPATVPRMPDLTDHERAVLDFEGLLYRRPGAKEQAIKDRFAMTATRYYQRLGPLLSRPEALAYAPLTVRRLERLQEHRQRRRALPAP